MRCKCCDEVMKTNEMCRKDQQGNYEDMCGKCLKAVGIEETQEEEVDND